MSKVFFMGSAYQGCYYLRCWLPLFFNNWTGSHVGFSKEKKDPKLVTAELQRSDIIVFHRADTVEHHKVGMQLKAQGKKIVFDNDDTFKLSEYHPFSNLDEKGFKENKEAKNNIINHFIENCDLVTASTEYLAEEYRKINPNVVVLPNYVDPDDWDEPLRNEGSKVRIGIVGSVAYHHDFHIIKDIIAELGKRDDVQLVLFGLYKGTKRTDNPLVTKTLKKEYKFWDTIKNLEHVPWVEMGEYFETLNELKLDMMLIPRLENNFNKSKSNVKFLEAAMCEIPVIASTFPDAPYEKDIDGENGILANTEKEWNEAINKLIKNKKARRLMGRRAKDYVLKNYNINDHYTDWVDAYRRLEK